MKHISYSSILSILLLILALSFFVSCDLLQGFLSDLSGNDQDGSVLSLSYIPVFSIPETKSRALIPEEDDLTSMTYGQMLLPQLRYLEEHTGTDDSISTISTSIFGQSYDGQITYDTTNETIEIVYDLGDTNGLIQIVFHNDETFDYNQYLILDYFSDSDTDRNLYALTEVEGGRIVQGSDSSSYTITGESHIYYGWIIPSGNEADEAMILDYDMGVATGYFRGGTDIVFGFVDPYTVPAGSYQSTEDRTISGKSIDEVTIQDLLAMDTTLDTASYSRDTDSGYPFNDIYYMVGENTYLGNLTADAWDPVSFQTATEGFTFTDLGAPESQNLFEFLADSFNLDYQLVGDNPVSEWTSTTVEEVTYYYCDFSVEADGLYAIPHENVQIWNTDNEQIAYPAYTELQENVTYRMACPESDVDTVPDNPYIYQL